MQFKGFTENQEEDIKEILKKAPNFFSLISLDNSLITNDDYKVFGKFNTKIRELKLNPKVFVAEDFLDKPTGRKMPMVNYVILHEVAHDVWNNLDEEKQKEWMKISGWQLAPVVREGLMNLIIPQNNNKQEVSNWYYDKNAENSFARWYSKKSPKEDFCDSWTFIKNGLIGRFDSDIGKQKIHFIEQLDSKPRK